MRHYNVEKDAATGTVSRAAWDAEPGLGVIGGHEGRTVRVGDVLTFHHAQPKSGTASWTVNGATDSAPLVEDAASGLWCDEIEVQATVAGPLVVTCNGETLTLTVTEAV